MSTTYLRKRHLHDADHSDRPYWLEQSFLERFRAVELISNPSLANMADFAGLLGRLIQQDVDFVIVGGYAVGIHGFPRYTGDLDVEALLDALIDDPDFAQRVREQRDAPNRFD